MRRLMMYHTLDRIPDVPVPEDFFIRNWKPGEEEIWLEICRCGLCAPDAGISAWDSAILGRENLKPEKGMSDSVILTGMTEVKLNRI